jgi:hypothetical protein
VAWVRGQWGPVSEAGFDHEQLAVFVWRADRAGGDTKTPKSRRTLALPRRCVEAVRERQATDLHPKTRDSILRQAGLNEDGSQADEPGRGES